MNKLRNAISNKENWSALSARIDIVEKEFYHNADIAMDTAKSILESVAKTILNDKGVEFDDEDFHVLVKRAVESLPVYGLVESKDRESIKRIASSISSVVNGIGEIRSRHGTISHGKDIHDKRAEQQLMKFAIDSCDVLSAFMIESHSCSFHNRKRIHYEENQDFNEWFDSQDEMEVSGILISRSKALYDQDIEAYKMELNAFRNEPENLVDAFDIVQEKENIVRSIIDIKQLLSESDLQRINQIIKDQQKIDLKIKNDLEKSGIIDSINKLNSQLKPIVNEIQVINKTVKETEGNKLHAK